MLEQRRTIAFIKQMHPPGAWHPPEQHILRFEQCPPFEPPLEHSKHPHQPQQAVWPCCEQIAGRAAARIKVVGWGQPHQAASRGFKVLPCKWGAIQVFIRRWRANRKPSTFAVTLLEGRATLANQNSSRVVGDQHL